MESWEKSRYIARLTSDRIKIIVRDQVFFIRPPTRFQRVLAEDIYYETLENADDAYSEDEIMDLLEDQKVWDKKTEDFFKRLSSDIENLKVKLFNERLRYNNLPIIRKALVDTEKQYDSLYKKRHSYDHLSRLSIAAGARDRFLLGASVYYANGKPYWPEDMGTEVWDTPDIFLNLIMAKLANQTISISDIREIARSEPWNSLWSMQKHCGARIFLTSPIELSDDQRSLVIWSSIYDSVREHPDNLQDSIINDDDMLDGWMILKRKEREKNHVKDDGLSKNPKIKGATEQFYMGYAGSDRTWQSVDEVKDFISSVNDPESLGVIKQRSSTIIEKGEVREGELPDVVLRHRQAQAKAFSDRIKQK